MATRDILYACGPGQRVANGYRGSADVAIRMVLVPFSLALTHGEVEDSMAGMTNTVFTFFSHILRSCGSGVPSRPSYRLMVEKIVSEHDFERARRTGNADVGNSPGQIRPIAYAMTILFTNDGYDAFAAEIDAELGRRQSAKHRKQPLRPGLHESIQSRPTLLRYLSYSADIEPGTELRLAQDERRAEPGAPPDGHLLDILAPDRSIGVSGACEHQMGSYVHPDTGDDEFSTKFYWQAPWSTAPGGTNPLIYMFGESWPWNLSGDSNDWNNTALIGTPTPPAKLKQITARRATARQKRRLVDWNVEHDGPFEKVFRGEDPIVGPLNDPRLSIPLFAPPPSQRKVSRVARAYEPNVNYELYGFRALGSVRHQTEQRLNSVEGPAGIVPLLNHLEKTVDLIETATGTVAPPQYAKRKEWGDDLELDMLDDDWAGTFFDKCETAEELQVRIQLCLAKFFGLSPAQIAFGYGLIFCGQVLPLLTTAPRMHIFCVGKAMAGKSVVVDVMTSFLFPSAIRRFDSASAQAAACDSVSGLTIQIIDESLKLTPGQLEQWKVMLSAGVNRRQRPWLNEEMQEFVMKTSVNVGLESTLATGNCPWQMQQPDPEGTTALMSRFVNVVMPNAAGKFEGSTNPYMERMRLGLRCFVHRATDMATVNTAGVHFGRGAIRIFYKFLEARGMPAYDRRRQDMFEAVVHGQMQLDLYIASRGLSRRDRIKLYLREGFFKVAHIAAAYKIFSEIDQVHVEEIIIKALASLVDFNRSFSAGEVTGIDVRTSDCGGYIALPSTMSTSRRAIPMLAASVAASVPKESQNKIPDTETVQRELMNMVDTGKIKIITVDQKQRYGILPSNLAHVRLPADRDVLSVLVMFASRMQIQQVTVDEENFILKEDVLDSLVRNDTDAHQPAVTAKWQSIVEKHGIDRLSESIARLKAVGVIQEKRSAYMASYVLASEDSTPADEQKRSVLKEGYNVTEGTKVNNVVVFSRTAASAPRSGSGAQTVGERVANDFIALCAQRTHLNKEVSSIVRFYGDSVVPATHMIRRPAAQQVIIKNPDYEGDAKCDGPEDDETHFFVSPKLKRFDLAKLGDLDTLSRRDHIRTNFPAVTDYDAFLAALA